LTRSKSGYLAAALTVAFIFAVVNVTYSGKDIFALAAVAARSVALAAALLAIGYAVVRTRSAPAAVPARADDPHHWVRFSRK
jgi:hypothetical protein